MTERPDWTAMDGKKRDALILKYFQEGLSASMVAAKFANASRNAVIGRRHRMEAKGIVFKAAKRGGRPRVPRDSGIRRQSAVTAVTKPNNALQASTVNKVLMRAVDPGISIAKVEAFKPIPGTKPIALVDIPARCKCRWPVDSDQPGHFYCGQPTVTEFNVYCATHRRLSVPSERFKEIHYGTRA